MIRNASTESAGWSKTARDAVASAALRLVATPVREKAEMPRSL
jgi:hypothetical protein